MKTFNWRYAQRLGFFLLVLLLDATMPLEATEIWLGGVDPFVRKAMKPAGTTDFQDLFAKDGAWPKAASNTAVFKTSTQWILNGSDEALSQMFTGLRERHIALAMEGLMIPRTKQCGPMIEGYSDPGEIEKAVSRIKKLGGTLDYIAMDEPLWFGHHFDGPSACHSSIEDVAASVAINVKVVRSIFPQIQIGDIEVISAAVGPGWTREITDWAKAYEKATGMPLAFFHADLNWSDQAIDMLPPLAAALHAQGIKFGVIYDGDPKDPSGVAWVRHAEARFETIETDRKLLPDQAILQTWMLQPDHMLPENADGTMTNLVLRYARMRSQITGTATGAGFNGRLIDASGKPIANAMISVLALQDGVSGDLSVKSLTGAVPNEATKALLVLRMNTECQCNGDADIGVGLAHFEDKGGVKADRIFSTKSADNLSQVSQFHATAGQALKVDSKPFAVTPGQLFQVSVPMRASPDASHSGYVALIFLGPDGKEMRRDELPFEPGYKTAASTKTDANGQFQTKGLARAAKIVFDGNDSYRGAEMTIGK